jgi:hypothetical protein
MTKLPDRELPCIMTISTVKERRSCLMCYCATVSPGTSQQQDMVILSKYQLVENPEKGVFC